MAALFGRGRSSKPAETAETMLADVVQGNRVQHGWQFSLKGSPAHYDDVRRIVESDGSAEVYFGEALTYERGAAVALWRIRATSFGWLSVLYEWWSDAERIEPVRFTIYLYIPPELKYPAMNLREHSPQEVEAFIKSRAPRS